MSGLNREIQRNRALFFRVIETSLSYYEVGLKIEEEEKKEGSQDKKILSLHLLHLLLLRASLETLIIVHMTLSRVYHLTGIRC